MAGVTRATSTLRGATMLVALRLMRSTPSLSLADTPLHHSQLRPWWLPKLGMQGARMICGQNDAVAILF